MDARIIRPKELKSVVGISNTTAWREEKNGRFPKRKKLTPGGAVGWLLSELQEWSKNLPQKAA